MGSPTESAFRETALRYGYDTWFVRDDPPIGGMGEAPIAGYRAGGSGYNFVPASDAFSSLATLRQSDWDLKLRTARTLYGPSYAHHFEPLTRSQIALFRRGDSALVVATYDASDDTLLAPRPLEAGLFAVPVLDSSTLGEAHGRVTSDAAASGVLTTTAPWGAVVASIELLDAKTKTAARARVGVPAPATGGRLGVSDLLMFSTRSSDSLPHRLSDAIGLALHSDHAGRNRLLGLFWETYGVRADGEHLAISVSIDRIKEGWMRRTAERLHLATPWAPMKLQWTEMPDQGNGVASRSVALNLSQLVPGRYEITLTVSPADGLPLVARRELTLDR